MSDYRRKDGYIGGAMKFLKAGQVRIEQLRDEIRRQVVEFPQMAIQWNQIDGIEIEDIDGKATTYQTELQTVVDDHTPTMEYFETEIAEAENTRMDTIKPQIVDAAKNLAGVAITDMTTNQLKLLLLALAFKSGAIDTQTLTIKPLGEWVK